MTPTKEDILNAMFSEMPYQLIGKEQVLPYIKEAMEIYAKSQWNAALETAAKNATVDFGLQGEDFPTVNKQSILKLKK